MPRPDPPRDELRSEASPVGLADLEGLAPRDLVDHLLDGDLTPEAERYARRRVAADPEAAEELELGLRLAELTAEALPLLECPPEVAARLDAAVARAAEARRRATPVGTAETIETTETTETTETAPASRWLPLREALAELLGGGSARPSRWRLAAAAAALGVLLLAPFVAVRMLHDSDPEGGPGVAPATAERGAVEAAPSPAEVDEATREARLALAMVAAVGQRTGGTLRDEVFEERIVAPARRAVGAALEGSPAASTAPTDADRPGPLRERTP